MISTVNLKRRNLLQQNILKLNELILPGFEFKEVRKAEKPYDYLISLILNKLHSLNVTLENNLLCNDIHQSVTTYRYMYELYIKVLCIFSEKGSSLKLEDFYSNKRATIQDWLDEIDTEMLPPKFLDTHKEHYARLSRIAHPNIDSLNMHYRKPYDQIFDFMVPNIKLTLWLQVNILILFTKKATVDSFKKLDVIELNQVLSNIDDKNSTKDNVSSV